MFLMELWFILTPGTGDFSLTWMCWQTDDALQALRSSFASFSQQEVENFKKVHLISREQFDCLTPEPPVDPNQEVPPGPPQPQQSKALRTRNPTHNSSTSLLLRH